LKKQKKAGAAEMVLFIKPQIKTSNYPMKSREFVCFVLLLLLLGKTIPVCGQTFVNTNADASLTFENAEAWNINVETTLELPHVSSQLTFSRDFKNLLYISGQDFSGNMIYDISLVVFSLESMKIVKTIKVTQGDYSILDRSLACSPDGKKVAYGPFDLRNIRSNTNMFIIDLGNSNVIGVVLDEKINGGARMCWPNSTNLDVLGFRRFSRPSYRINLDTLEVNDLPTDIDQAERASFRVQTHKNCAFDLSASLDVFSRQHPYKRVLLQNAASEISETVPVWTPDLRYVVIQTRNLGSSGNLFDGNTPTSLIKLGLRPTPILDFEIKGLDQTLTPEQRQIIKNTFNEGKRIWLSVYNRKINPLTDRLLGPDESKNFGQGFLTQIEPTFKFKYSFENLPAQVSNIVSSLQVDNGENWGTKVWGELVKVGDGEPKP
jgi:hypothetical protein